MSDEFEREDDKFDILDLKKGSVLDLDTEEEAVDDELLDPEEDPAASYSLYDNESGIEDGEYSY